MTAGARIVRRHRRRTDDGKGLRRLIAGERFRLPVGVEAREADQRFLHIEEIWSDNQAFCERFGKRLVWTDIAIWATEHVRRGEQRVPLPSTDDIITSFDPDGVLDERLQSVVHAYLEDDCTCDLPLTPEEVSSRQADIIHEVLSDLFPSANWRLPVRHAERIVSIRERIARTSLDRLARVKDDVPPDPAKPIITGTFHEALRAYEKKRRADFTDEQTGVFDGSGHHMLGLIKAFQERMADVPLAQLDLPRCQQVFDYWRGRPEDPRSKTKPKARLSKKTCGNYIGELDRFFNWLHVCRVFDWRKPEDFEYVARSIKDLPTDRTAVVEMQVKTFSVDHLALLFKHALPSERLRFLWCLNCAHGAAEVGRVAWEDLFLNQPHPWKKEGFQIDSSGDDSWCGFIRPKSGVLGWWLLWPETVTLVNWWKGECRRWLRRPPKESKRLMITKEGTPLYRDESRNGQTGFANEWRRLLDRLKKIEGDEAVPDLPFGTLRDQLSDWLGSEQVDPVVASTALAHGIPHKGDRLLYKHYSNRPWKALFEAQRQYRIHLQPMFDAVPDVLAVFDPVAERLRALWGQGEHDVGRLAQQLDVSSSTVRRKMKEHHLSRR
ncbi:MAG TPA: hypothetical protein VHC22_13525 [Pirellulales bacterium]|nr:hypothetical protein [Pirellulales bacterium]